MSEGGGGGAAADGHQESVTLRYLWRDEWSDERGNDRKIAGGGGGGGKNELELKSTSC